MGKVVLLALLLTLVFACTPTLVEQDVTPATRDLTFQGPAVLRGSQAGAIRTKALLTVHLSRDSDYARQYLDYSGHLAFRDGLPFRLSWRILRADEQTFPSSFFEGVPIVQLDPGQLASFHMTMSNLVPPGSYTLEVQFFHGAIPHSGNAITPTLRQQIEVYAPPPLSSAIRMTAHYAIDATTFRTIKSSDTAATEQQLVPADNIHPATIFVRIEQAQVNSAYSIGFFTFDTLPAWIKLITFSSTTPVKANAGHLAPLTNNSEITINRTTTGAPVLDNILLPLNTGASGSTTDALIELKLEDQDGLSLPLNVRVNLHTA